MKLTPRFKEGDLVVELYNESHPVTLSKIKVIRNALVILDSGRVYSATTNLSLMDNCFSIRVYDRDRDTPLIEWWSAWRVMESSWEMIKKKQGKNTLPGSVTLLPLFKAAAYVLAQISARV